MAPPRALLLTVLLLVLPLGGCLGDDAATEEEQAPEQPGDEGEQDVVPVPPASPPPGNGSVSRNATAWPAVVHLPSCRQFHTIFPGPREGFEAYLPDGFEPASEDPADGTVNVFVYVSLCSEGHFLGAPPEVAALEARSVEELAAYLPVVPPSDFGGGSFDFELVPLGTLTTSPRLAAQYAAWSFADVEEAALETSSIDSPAGRSETIAFAGASQRLEIGCTSTAESEPFPSSTFRIWLSQAGAITGWLDMRYGDSTSIGRGSATFQSQGGDAPPLTAGICHTVEGAEVVLTHVPVPPATP